MAVSGLVLAMVLEPIGFPNGFPKTFAARARTRRSTLAAEEGLRGFLWDLWLRRVSPEGDFLSRCESLDEKVREIDNNFLLPRPNVVPVVVIPNRTGEFGERFFKAPIGHMEESLVREKLVQLSVSHRMNLIILVVAPDFCRGYHIGR